MPDCFSDASEQNHPQTHFCLPFASAAQADTFLVPIGAERMHLQKIKCACTCLQTLMVNCSLFHNAHQPRERQEEEEQPLSLLSPEKPQAPQQVVWVPTLVNLLS